MKYAVYGEWIKLHYERLVEGAIRAVSEISPYLNSQIRYYRSYGTFANIKNPSTFAEKIIWLKLYAYANDKTVEICSDKFGVRDYVASRGYGEILNELIAVYKTPEEINFDSLPRKFVLKWNFGSGYNYLCPDKEKINKDNMLKTMKEWGSKEYWRIYGEKQYKSVEKKIVCEKYLGDEEKLLDYKIYCFHGIPKAILIIKRNDSIAKAIFKDTNWKTIQADFCRYIEMDDLDPPKSLDEMIDAARALSKGFPFVRVDFYDVDGKAVFGEMTFTPMGGIRPSETRLSVMNMGAMINVG